MKQAKKTRPEASVHALVLSGCGSSSTAAYEVGAMKALAEGGCAHLDGIHLDPAIYSGSAFGAFNAAIMASQIGGDMASTLSYLERVWLEDLSSTPTSCGNGETLEVDRETNENHITIHRYRPRRSPVNWFEFANFDRKKTEEHIAQGYDDTRAHDCKSEGCTLAT